ncbi:hypothetical protein CN163_32295 [Sinorhizobium meliloti]|nr:hypothetical protein CN163_32295 [Sinorhizobium meliloti]
MTTAPPPAHYGAVKGALASGFATAELHHLWGHDLASRAHPVIHKLPRSIHHAFALLIQGRSGHSCQKPEDLQ